MKEESAESIIELMNEFSEEMLFKSPAPIIT